MGGTQDRGTPLVRFPVLPGMRLARAGTPTARSVRLVDVLNAEGESLKPFKDALVFVGVSASGAGEMDRRSTPLGWDLPGTWLHVSAAIQLLERASLVTGGPGGTGWLLAAVALVLGVVFAWMRVTRTALVGVTALVAVAGWRLVVAWALSHGRRVVLPVLGWILLVALGELVMRGGASELTRRRIRHALAHHVGPSVVEQLVREPERLRLGGERRAVTAFFSDIKGFTTDSEQLDPADLVSVRNAYLGPMTEIILEGRAPSTRSSATPSWPCSARRWTSRTTPAGPLAPPCAVSGRWRRCAASAPPAGCRFCTSALDSTRARRWWATSARRAGSTTR
ncbi:MAG: CHASE2 domain-containing protein [Deltaproteobacteria bacterium]|nr:CHASE2 domain-containing protein [Deltaproteobacteria bacterium]